MTTSIRASILVPVKIFIWKNLIDKVKVKNVRSSCHSNLVQGPLSATY